MDNENLMTYCGGYCGECALYPGFTALREAASLLGEIIDTHGLQNWIPEAMKPEAENKFDFAEFRKGLAFFSDPEPWFTCQKNCKNWGGFPDCLMRKCCREHRLDICFDCSEFPCSKVRWNPRMIERAKEYEKLGKEEWLRQQQKKANQGFEHFADKYYQVQAGKSPPKS